MLSDVSDARLTLSSASSLESPNDAVISAV
jgi:hypothetical protein